MKESKYVLLLSIVIDREIKNSGCKTFMISAGDMTKMVRQRQVNAEQMMIEYPGVKLVADSSLPDDHLKVVCFRQVIHQ